MNVRKILIFSGVVLVALSVIAKLINGVHPSSGLENCVKTCTKKGKFYEYTPPELGFRNKQINPEYCRCF